MPASRVVSLYKQAVSLAEARCRAAERAWISHEAGTYMLTQADHNVRAQAESILRHAEHWLAERGISS